MKEINDIDDDLFTSQVVLSISFLFIYVSPFLPQDLII